MGVRRHRTAADKEKARVANCERARAWGQRRRAALAAMPEHLRMAARGKGPRHQGTNANLGRQRSTAKLGGGVAAERRERLRAAARARGDPMTLVMMPDWLHCRCYDFDLRADMPRIVGLMWRCRHGCPCAPESEREAAMRGEHHPNWPRVPGRARAG